MLNGVCGADGGRATRQDAKFVEEVIMPAYDHLDDALKKKKKKTEITESKADAA